jgi:hypothetical protein
MEEEYQGELRTPSRRGTYSKLEMEGAVSGIAVPGSSIPTPGARRQSGSTSVGRRTSTGISTTRPGTANSRKLSDLGETY